MDSCDSTGRSTNCDGRYHKTQQAVAHGASVDLLTNFTCL